MINVNLLYPVGSIYISVNSKNPSEIFGGTWERIKGKMLVGVDEDDADLSQSGKTGGEKEVTLTIDEIPEHIHGNYLPSNNTGSETVSAYGHYFNDNVFGYSAGGRVMHIPNITIGTREAGGGQAHNNMPPYYTVYIFVRTA